MRCVMDGSSFTIPGETPCADPHAGCCGGWGLETPGYPIMCLLSTWDYHFLIHLVPPVLHPNAQRFSLDHQSEKNP